METLSTAISTPNNTLYIANIDWKIKKPLLRRALYSLFSRHGKVRTQNASSGPCPTSKCLTFSVSILCQVLEVVTLRRQGLRGQAWVIFEETQSATAAIQAEHGFTFFGKDLKLNYSREVSDRIAKRDGTYVAKAKRKKLVPSTLTAETTSTTTASAPSTTVSTAPAPSSAAPTEQPSHILFAVNLPPECNEMMLSMLFRQYSGFKEVRIPRPGLAFCEFDDEPHATLALERLNGFKLTSTDSLKLTYGKA
jgi:U2 small nuclear ribonucleoprotein B''